MTVTAGPPFGDSAGERGKKHLPRESHCPELGIRTVDQANVGNDPLSIKRSEAVPYRGDTGPGLLGNGPIANSVAQSEFEIDAIDVAITKSLLVQMRMEQFLLHRNRGGNESVPTDVAVEGRKVETPQCD